MRGDNLNFKIVVRIALTQIGDDYMTVVSAMEALKAAVKDAGMTYTAVGKALGHNATYIPSSLSRGVTPAADRLADMLGACGYGLYAIPRRRAPRDAMRIRGASESGDTDAQASTSQ